MRTVLPLVPALLLAAVVSPFLYVDTVGERDLLRMINGILHGHQTHRSFEAGWHYGWSFSFGWYWIMYHLPERILNDATRLLNTVNRIGFGSAVLGCGFFGLLGSRRFDPWTGAAMAALVWLSPIGLEMATSGHPLVLSAALFFGGGLLLHETRARGRLPAAFLATALLGTSLTVRSETLLAFPWLFLLLIGGRSKRSELARLGATFGAATIAFFLVQRNVVGGTAEQAGFLSEFLSRSYDFDRMGNGSVYLALGSGLGTLLLLLSAVPAAWRAGREPAIWAFALLAAVTLVFWLPNPKPARHFFYTLVAFSGLATLGLRSRCGPRVMLALAGGAVLANQLLGELAYAPVVKRYDWRYAALGDRRVTPAVPLGFFRTNHRALQELFRERRREGRALATTDAPEVVVFGDGMQYMVLGLLESGRVAERERPSEGRFTIDRGGQKFYFIEKYVRWPRDALADYLEADPHPEAAIYVQRTTVSRFDRTPVPEERALSLEF